MTKHEAENKNHNNTIETTISSCETTDKLKVKDETPQEIATTNKEGIEAYNEYELPAANVKLFDSEVKPVIGKTNHKDNNIGQNTSAKTFPNKMVIESENKIHMTNSSAPRTDILKPDEASESNTIDVKTLGTKLADENHFEAMEYMQESDEKIIKDTVPEIPKEVALIELDDIDKVTEETEPTTKQKKPQIIRNTNSKKTAELIEDENEGGNIPLKPNKNCNLNFCKVDETNIEPFQNEHLEKNFRMKPMHINLTKKKKNNFNCKRKNKPGRNTTSTETRTKNMNHVENKSTKKPFKKLELKSPMGTTFKKSIETSQKMAISKTQLQPSTKGKIY